MMVSVYAGLLCILSYTEKASGSISLSFCKIHSESYCTNKSRECKVVRAVIHSHAGGAQPEWDLDLSSLTAEMDHNVQESALGRIIGFWFGRNGLMLIC